MRDIINKGVEEEDVLATAEAAIRGGWENLKFYFMIGLPFETDEDVAEIFELASKVIKRCRPISKRINVTVSVFKLCSKTSYTIPMVRTDGYRRDEKKTQNIKRLI